MSNTTHIELLPYILKQLKLIYEKENLILNCWNFINNSLFGQPDRFHI